MSDVQPEIRSGDGDDSAFVVKRKPRAKRSGFHRQPGARTMKEYPLTSAEMWTLAGIGFAATLAFGVGSFFLSTWFDVFKDLSAPPPEWTAETLGYWRAVRMGSGWATLACYGVGCILTVINGLSVRRIMRETEHPD